MSGQGTNDAEHKAKTVEQYDTGITLQHNNTATNNTQCQPSNTIRRSTRRYISASDRPGWWEGGAVEWKGLLERTKGGMGGFAGARLNWNAPARAAACLVLGRGHSRRYKYFFFSFFSVLLRSLKDIYLIY
jgi:hypothetical protein